MAQRSILPLVPIALLLFGLVAILLLTIPTEDIRGDPGFRYGIVLDAGSSHTCLYIYKWPADKQNGTGVVTQHSECNVMQGISSYAGQKGEAGKSLERCLSDAVEKIPKDKHQNTPVYLGATAGMRLLHISNPEQSKQILEEVGLKIESYPFNYQGAAILSGQEEGAYGWVTVNYLSENFIKYGFVGSWFSSNRPTVGALDFGGASTQISFVTQERVESNHDMMKLRLYGHEYSLYTHSFLCSGKNQFLKRLLAHLVKTQGFSQRITHPCYPPNYNMDLTIDDIFDSPCTKEQKPDSYKPQASLSVRGSGHYEHCVGNVSALFDFDGCTFSKCSFDGVFQPNISGSFMAFSAFYYIHAFLENISGITVSTSQQMEEATKILCNMTMSLIKSLASGDEPLLRDYCASSVFVQILLLRGYGFDDESFQRISFQKEAGDTSVGWALGYMLNLTNLLPAESVGMKKALTLGAWGTLLFLFVILLVVVLAFILLHNRDRKKEQDQSTI